jgi:two-component system, OmpR family, sensor histidine kinase SenX3
MVGGSHRKSVAAFITLGSSVVVLTVALNIGWIVLNWRTGVLLVLGIIFFGVIISGVVLNTIFLVREVRRNEQHDAFINAVTHELKTPVASIRLYLETLQSRDISDAKRREFYNIMLADSDRLLGTIEQVLRAGRTSAYRRHHQRTRLDLAELLKECMMLARTRHHLPDDALRFNGDVAPTERVVMGDGEELKAAISNLLDNAVKYSGQCVLVTVELSKAPKQRLQGRITDCGVGIPQAELKRIFKRFYRVPGSLAARVKGTGLGLFIVRSVVEKHGGRVWAESEGAGLGSTFSLQLPGAPIES